MLPPTTTTATTEDAFLMREGSCEPDAPSVYTDYQILPCVLRHSSPPLPSQDLRISTECPLTNVSSRLDDVVALDTNTVDVQVAVAEQEPALDNHGHDCLPWEAASLESADSDNGIRSQSRHTWATAAGVAAFLQPLSARAEGGDRARETGWSDDEQSTGNEGNGQRSVSASISVPSQTHGVVDKRSKEQTHHHDSQSADDESLPLRTVSALGHVDVSRRPGAKNPIHPAVRAGPTEERYMFASSSISALRLHVSDNKDDAGVMLRAPRSEPATDVSPLLLPLRLSLGGSMEEELLLTFKRDEHQGSSARGTSSHAKEHEQKAYKSEQIAGDLSPMFLHEIAAMDRPTRPTRPTRPAEDEASRLPAPDLQREPKGDTEGGIGGDVGVVVPEASQQKPPHLGRPLRPGRAGSSDLTKRVPIHLHIVHAVEEYAASNSSLSSWERDSDANQSPSVSSQAMDMQEESQLNTLVASPHPITATTTTTTTQAASRDKADFSEHPPQPAESMMHQAQQLPSSSKLEITASPERSRSLLSQISAVVSDGGNPISPTPSTAGRSTPSTIRRMHYDTTARNPLNPGQIPEESVSNPRDHTPALGDDEFDLYADHNGAVKGVRDASGQAIPGPDAQTSPSAHHSQPSKTSISDIDPKDEPEDRQGRRYSMDRPMSFISGPPDSDGKPQDQINQFAPKGTVPLPPVPVQYPSQVPQQRAAPPPPGAAIPIGKLADVDQVQNTGHLASPMTQSLQELGSQDKRMQATNPVEYRNVIASTQNTSSTPQNVSMHPAQGERVIPNGLALPNGQIRHDASSYGPPQSYQIHPGISTPQGPQAQGTMLMPDHDPRVQAVPFGQPSPHQPMLQNPALRNIGPQPALAPTPQPRLQPSAPPASQEKQSAKVRLSSVLKLVSKAQASTQQFKKTPGTATASSGLHLPPAGPNRNGSMHSGTGSLAQSHDQPVGGLREHVGTSAHPNRPLSFGTESRPSQSSTRVQPTSSHPDLVKSTSPARYEGAPPQNTQVATAGSSSQPPRPLPAPYGFSGQPLAPQEPILGSHEIGKKKRLSAISGLFSRAGSSIPTKLKMSKEEKQTSKAPRLAADSQMHTSMQQWPPQQQQYRPQQPGVPYPPTQISPQPMLGMHPTGPRFASPTTLLPAPQMPPNVLGMSQQMIAQQMITQQHQQQPLQQRFSAQQAVSGSPAFDNQLALQNAHYQQALQQQVLQQQALLQRGMPGQLTQQPRQLSIPEHGAYDIPKAQQMQQAVPGQNINIALHNEYLLAQKRQQFMAQQSTYMASEDDRMQASSRHQQQHQQQQQSMPLSQEQEAYGISQIGRQPPQLQRQPMVQQMAYGPLPASRQNSEQQRQHSMNRHSNQNVLYDEHTRTHQQQFQDEAQQQPGQQQRIPTQPVNIQPLPREQFTYEPSTDISLNKNIVTPQQDNGKPVLEPQYDAPPIPAAYTHVQGAFMSPRDQSQQHSSTSNGSPAHPSTYQSDRQRPGPQMPLTSPQPLLPPLPLDKGTPSGTGTSSMDFHTSSPPSGSMTAATTGLKADKQEANDISNGQQEKQYWHANLPQDATEQEIVRARQKQFIGAQFTAQQQLQTEKLAQFASSQPNPHGGTPIPSSELTRQPSAPNGGFVQVLPSTSQQLRSASQVRPHRAPSDQKSEQSAYVHNEQRDVQPADFPLPSSPASANFQSIEKPLVDALPQKDRNADAGLRQNDTKPLPERTHSSPLLQTSSEQQQSGESTRIQSLSDNQANLHKNTNVSRSEPPGSSKIMTNASAGDFESQREVRERQPSIGILQHPQPASMAASPQQSTTVDMGAEALRRQLLQQDEHARIQHKQQPQSQRSESSREKREREFARARARELERSASGGGRVGSLRSVTGSRNGGAPGWERRGEAASRPVFELPAVEDDEPSMKATSYPGQEWVPSSWTDD